MRTLALIVILAGIFFSCSESKKSNISDSTYSNPLLKAEVITWQALSDTQKLMISEYNYIHLGNEKYKEFDREKAYYVVALIDIVSLVHLSEPTDFKSHKLIKYENPYVIYGNDKNLWSFLKDALLIKTTEKYTGFPIVELKRNKANTQDKLLIGPIPDRPDLMKVVYLSDGPRKEDVLKLN